MCIFSLSQLWPWLWRWVSQALACVKKIVIKTNKPFLEVKHLTLVSGRRRIRSHCEQEIISYKDVSLYFARPPNKTGPRKNVYHSFNLKCWTGSCGYSYLFGTGEPFSSNSFSMHQPQATSLFSLVDYNKGDKNCTVAVGVNYFISIRRRPYLARYLSKTEIFQIYMNKSVSTTSVFKSYLPVHTDMRNQNDSKTPASTNSACARLRSLGNRELADWKSALTSSFFGFFLPRTKKSGSHLWSHRKSLISFVHTNLINRFQKLRSGACMKKKIPAFGDRKRRHYTCGQENRVEISVFENDPH